MSNIFLTKISLIEVLKNDVKLEKLVIHEDGTIEEQKFEASMEVENEPPLVADDSHKNPPALVESENHQSYDEHIGKSSQTRTLSAGLY